MSENGHLPQVTAHDRPSGSVITFERLELTPNIMALVQADGDIMLAAERLGIDPKVLYQEAMVRMAEYNFISRGNALRALYNDVRDKAESGDLSPSEVERLVALLEGKTPITFNQTTNIDARSGQGVTVLNWE